MALYADNDPMVPVAFPDGSMRPMPSSLAMQLGVHPDQMAPQDPGTQHTMSDYGTATGLSSLPVFPPSTIVQPPTPPPDAAFPLPRQIPKGQSALPPPPAPPVKKLGQTGGGPTPYGGETAAPSPMGFDNVQQQRALTSSPTGGVDAISGAAPIAPTEANKPLPGSPPLTTQGLRDMGEAGAANEKIGALNAAANAGVATADVEAHAQTSFADAYEKRNAQIDGLLKQRADAADARQREIEGRMATYDTMVKKYADTKIDRSVDHPIMAAIGVALAGLGTAMKGGGENPALKILFESIDRKVAGQMQDRDALGTKIGYQRAGIDLARTAATDKSAQYNLAIAGETEKAARQIEALGARSNSDIVRSRAQEGAALLRGKVADVVGQAVMSQQGKDERDRAFTEQLRATKVHEKNESAQLGLGYANLAQHKTEFAWQKEYQGKQLELEADKLLQAGKTNEAQLLQKRGIGGVASIQKDANGNIVLDKDGQPTVKQDILRNKDGSPFIATGTDEAVSKLIDQKAATDTLVNLMDEAQRLRTGWSNSAVNRSEFQRINANWQAAKAAAKDLLQLGALSESDYALMDGFLGSSDPTKMLSQSAGISQARKNIVMMFNNKAKAHGLDGEYTPEDLSNLPGPAKSPDEQSFQTVLDKSPAQRAYENVVPWSAPAGDIAPQKKAVLDQYAKVISDPNTTDAAKKQAREFLAKAYDPKLSSDPAVRTYARSLDTDVAVGANAGGATSREEPAGSSGGGARDTSYGGSAQTMAKQKVLETAPLESLTQQAVIGSGRPDGIEARREIARRAAAGDKSAAKAAAYVVQQAGGR